MKLKLTLRDLFWLVLVAAVVVAWWIDHRHQAGEIWRLNARDPWEHFTPTNRGWEW